MHSRQWPLQESGKAAAKDVNHWRLIAQNQLRLSYYTMSSAIPRMCFRCPVIIQQAGYHRRHRDRIQVLPVGNMQVVTQQFCRDLYQMLLRQFYFDLGLHNRVRQYTLINQKIDKGIDCP